MFTLFSRMKGPLGSLASPDLAKEDPSWPATGGANFLTDQLQVRSARDPCVRARFRAGGRERRRWGFAALCSIFVTALSAPVCFCCSQALRWVQQNIKGSLRGGPRLASTLIHHFLMSASAFFRRCSNLPSSALRACLLCLDSTRLD